VLDKEGTERVEVSLMDGVHDGHSDRIVVTNSTAPPYRQRLSSRRPDLSARRCLQIPA